MKLKSFSLKRVPTGRYKPAAPTTSKFFFETPPDQLTYVNKPTPTDAIAISVFTWVEEGKIHKTASVRNHVQDRQAEDDKRKAADAAIAEANARAKRFLDKNGFKQLSDTNAVLGNPFALEGQKVLLKLHFERMQTATQGLFGADISYLVMSGIPRGRFTTPERVFAVGKVLGTVEVKSGAGSTQLTHLEFVDAYDCPLSGIYYCKEMYDQLGLQ